MKVTFKGVSKYVAALVLAAVLLYFAFRKISWDDFVNGLSSCNFYWIIATMAIQWLITYLRGNRWRVMMLSMNSSISRRETYDSYSLCYLANLVFPRSGEVIRCGLMSATHKVSFEGALGSVVIERTWDMVCVILATIPLFFFGTFKDFIINKMFRPAAEAMDISLLWILAAIVFLTVSIVTVLVLCRRKISSTKIGQVIFRFLKGILSGLKAGLKMERKWLFFLYTAVIWFGYWMTSYMTILAFDCTSALTVIDALFIMVVGSLGWIVPVQGGFGAYHFIVAGTLVPIYGFTYQTGLVFATISHESQVVQMVLCGLLSLVSWFFYKKKIDRIKI